MSNSWFYDILLSSQITLSTEKINNALALAEAIGYSAKNPISGMVSVMSTDGTESLEFAHIMEAITHLSADGGLLSLWKDDEDIGLWIDPAGTKMDASTDLQTSSTFRTISIIVGDHYFRDPATRREIAKNVQELFTSFCTMLNPVYGYSADEVVIETFMSRLHIQEDIRLYGKPSILFWFNYFTAEQLTQREIDGIQSLGGRIAELSSGVIISFFNYPWEVDIRELKSLNEQWQRLSSGQE